MWSRPPNVSPILTSDWPLHSRIRYIATWRAVVSGLERFGEIEVIWTGQHGLRADELLIDIYEG